MRTVGARGGVACFGVNRIGLERRGFPPEAVEGLQAAWRLLRRGRAQGEATLDRIREEHGAVFEVRELCDFVEAARGGRGYHG
jgi:UDP-N-acetylglucosamine acyltransferase